MESLQGAAHLNGEIGLALRFNADSGRRLDCHLCSPVDEWHPCHSQWFLLTSLVSLLVCAVGFVTGPRVGLFVLLMFTCCTSKCCICCEFISLCMLCTQYTFFRVSAMRARVGYWIDATCRYGLSERGWVGWGLGVGNFLWKRVADLNQQGLRSTQRATQCHSLRTMQSNKPNLRNKPQTASKK